MPSDAVETDALSTAFAEHWPRLVADLARRHADLELAEDAVADAFAEALRTWRTSVPGNPGGWLRTAARRRAIDRIRAQEASGRRERAVARPEDEPDDHAGPGHDPVRDQLALLFGCCHPCLPQESQVALTLRSVNGLTTADIARLFLTSADTMTRRLHRARAKLRAYAVPFRVPEPDQWPERLAPVLQAIYLTFTAGYSSESHDTTFVRGDLCDEARWLAQLLAAAAPDDPEIAGLLALMDFTDARRRARVAPDGSAVTLEEQDRSLWDRAAMESGRTRLRAALRQRRIGPFQAQAALSACHAMAPTWQETNWAEIISWYDVLLAVDPSSVHALNRAVALTLGGRAAEALAAMDGVSEELADYPYLWVARAEALERLGRSAEALEAVARADAAGLHPSQEKHLHRRVERLRGVRSP